MTQLLDSRKQQQTSTPTGDPKPEFTNADFQSALAKWLGTDVSHVWTVDDTKKFVDMWMSGQPIANVPFLGDLARNELTGIISGWEGHKISDITASADIIRAITTGGFSGIDPNIARATDRSTAFLNSILGNIPAFLALGVGAILCLFGLVEIMGALKSDG